ncbi:helix-turn-helix transcriptional regulator [Streptomyces flavofungini]|uniref:Helix-turn-helix domain-containing protein n=1 Tax=Streptomyces flavofungini TaxID=68200 RepID=A0ABS0X9B6_9ACTN|nr:helix-turn-helix transcriptional regulator [Streptomyces flavofungini]MBJ3809803.1 helix-turn-helix domain-containing protein [Streptomyces flavofungini]GHC80832.1 transcriptional regulator [Streptomyces flavofungini]
MNRVGERVRGGAEADGGEAGASVDAVSAAGAGSTGSSGGRGRGGLDGIDGVGDAERALGGFLRARRGRVAPEHVGISGGRRRRVRGLRREELAQLAGISVDYYVRLEQGRATQPSPEVLEALAGALGLDPAERKHLDTLAGTRRGTAPKARVSPLLQRVLDSLTGFPVFATNHRLDVVAWNALGAELVGGLGDGGRRDPNNARFLFLDPASRTVHPEWEGRAAEAVGQLRVSAGRYPDDTELAALISELSEHSADFRRIWGTGEIVMCKAGRKPLHHPLTGPLTLDFETLHVPAEPGETGLVVHVFSADEGSEEAAALARLARYVAERG